MLKKEPKVTFCRGKKKFYNEDSFKNSVYFAPDTREIIVNGVVYGVSTSWETKVLNSIVNIEKDEIELAKFIATRNDGTTVAIDFSQDIKGAINTSINDSIKEVSTQYEEDLKELDETLREDISKTDIKYDPELKKIQISLLGKDLTTGIDATPFLKDGMLKDVQYLETPETYQVLNEDGSPVTDENGNIVTDTWKDVPYLRFEFNEDWAKTNNIKLNRTIVRIPLKQLIDVYKGSGAIETSTKDKNGVTTISLTPEFISSLGINENEDGSWNFVRNNTKYITDSQSIADSLIRLDQEVQKINATNAGTVVVTDTDENGVTNKYVNVDCVVTGTESKYIVKEDLDNTLMGWDELNDEYESSNF